ncbi:LCP family protein [Kitasatospora sp. GP82]|uniref:LCP family protein n=1 Tax=Kitasatospora sp. GP82 TaxID=3035089 RepID=UPI002474240F|nr:LCP family protein [Kitasatospora sp. GP82]MDH6124087.1 LCP family protein required for cell wall assembly [Kitasatospora sp. GP82]
MNSGHRYSNSASKGPRREVDPAGQWVRDPATGEFRLDPERRTAAVPRPRTGESADPPSGTPNDAAPGGRAARRRSHGSRWVLKWTAGAGTLALVVGCGGAFYAYRYFNRNISAVDVNLGNEADRPAAVTDALNILVIGTDSREGLGREYGDEGSAGHADTTLLFHVAKDRSNATVISIPRDLMVQIPDCQTGTTKIPGESRTMFNASLGQAGRDPGCTWKTVEKLTNIRVDHFMMVNFEAVKTLSTAVDGVEVCAAKDIDDPGSHLKMSKGRHTVQGEEALAFVRTRHSVGLGGDLTRIPLQQQFIGSMIRRMKSSDTLTSPTKLWRLADAATRALTVDSQIKGIDKLKNLALDLSRVDTRNITFTTVPVADDPRNDGRLILTPDAARLFALIAADRSLTATTAPSTGPSAGAAASGVPSAPPVDPAQVKVTVRNGTGQPGRAGKAATSLQGKGFTNAAAGRDAETAATSTVSYPPGRADQAAALATALGLPAGAARENSRYGARDPLVAVLGKDYTGVGGPAPVPTEVPKDLQRVQADDTEVCAK